MAIHVVEKETKEIINISEKIWEYFSSEDLWNFIVGASIKIIAIFLLSYLIVFIGKRIIARIFKLRMQSPLKYSERRQQTLLKLSQSVLSYVVYFSAIIGALSSLNINVAGLLAGAGIAGLAIGFGAQNLVKDVITGFFIIFEDQFGVGDYVRINTSSAAEGTVTEIGLRTTKIVGTTGEVYIVPNGQITEVVNFSLNNSKAVIDMQVGIEADIEKIENVMTEYLKTLPKQYEELVDVPKFVGVQNVTGTEITIRIVAETKPQQHYGIARIIRRDVKKILEKNGIPMAYPKMMIYDSSKAMSRGDEN
ncbi:MULTISPECIES: mechanosensitive ion channel family protein [Ureibacillus]|jgi:moderate conductance mechanosensitive channel|uniref:Small conductance mechanosensitive channel n=1 Tax=Ureibacillus thermosphaericus TaxID=51173 RepID=A0A840PMH4_URETH|nr:mechanosensitive ion channel family protein [Ureibacillus thermosphaericus]MBB5149615.1 small conductance mechanosensitive channel [Ureibacillus thermosphaericus]NKZ32016.1 mechanosensitive ion channel family protein [Ureibacillus thermosphaericus]